MSALADHGIRLRREQPGEHRCPCPECARAKPRRGDEALAVKLEPDGGATWLCHRCGWSGGLPAPGRERRKTVTGPKQFHARPPAARVRNSDRSVRVFPDPATDRRWTGSRPVEPGSVAAAYLAGRGCALPHPEGDLRWHPDVPHWPSGWAGPALVALVTDPVTVAPMTLHLTFRRPDGSGKADLACPRLYLAGHPKLGGVVRLWPDEAVTTGLCVAEGLETALTAARGFGLAWACLDAANLAALPLLAGVEALTVAVDHDRAGLAAFNVVAARWVAAGCEVFEWLPPGHGKDINDWAGEAA